MKMNYEVNVKISSEIYSKNRWYDFKVQKIGDRKLHTRFISWSDYWQCQLFDCKQLRNNNYTWTSYTETALAFAHDCHILSERIVERLKQFNKRTNYFLKRTINFRNCTNDFSIIVQTVFLSYKRLKKYNKRHSKSYN